MRIINGWHDFSKNKIYFYVQNNGIKSTIDYNINFLPYFYTVAEVKNPLIARTEQVEVQNGKFYKHTCKSPWDVKTITSQLQSQNIQTFEADVPFVYRFILDNHVNLGDEQLSVLYFDIETITPVERMPTADKDRITCIGCTDKQGNFQFFADKDEKKLILDFFNHASKYSVLTGWYIDDFDVPYIQKRCEKLGITWKQLFLQWQFADLLHMYKATRMALYPVDSYRLADVSEKELGMTKLSKQALISEDIEVLKKYSERDVIMLKELDSKLRLTELYDNFAKLGNVFYTNAIRFAQISNYLVLQNSLGKYIHRNKPYVSEAEYKRKDRKHYTGAFVMQPKCGVHQNVVGIDFSGHYPNIIRTFNISFDTKSRDGTITAPGNGVKFTTTKGIYPELFERFSTLRNQYIETRDRFAVGSHDYEIYNCLQESTKYLINSFYGTLGYKGSRYNDIDLVEAVTKTGQWLVKKVMEILQRIGIEVIYGDTDSVYYVSSLTDFVLNTTKICDVINSELKNILINEYGCQPDNYHIRVSFESFYSKFVLLKDTKKRYFGNLTWYKGQACDIIKSKGIEIRRGDWCPLAKQVQTEVIKMFLQQATFQQIQQYLQHIKQSLLSGQVNNSMLTINKALSRLFKDYKTLPIHAQVAQKYSEKNHKVWFLGEKVAYIITGTDSNGKLTAKYAEDDNVKPDYQYYWDSQVMAPVERILETISPETQKSLGSFL